LWGKHKAVNGWQGVLGLHYTHSDFSAEGEEAFTPSTETTNTALFVLEEKTIGNFLWQLGARLEHIKHQPDNAFFVDSQVDARFDDVSYTANSASAGFVYSLNDEQSFALITPILSAPPRQQRYSQTAFISVPLPMKWGRVLI